MKRAYIILCSLWVFLSVNAQQYPPEWAKYTLGGYMYDIQSDSNEKNLPETDFKNYLLNIARTNLAKQVQVRVQDVANLDKQSVNGKTTITYSANTIFSTNVNLKLVETKTAYDLGEKVGYAIAYIDRDAARNYYLNELMLIHNKIENSIVLAENFVEAGFKSKAQSQLESSLKQFALIDEPLLWMNIFGASQRILAEWSERFSAKEQTVKRMLADLKHATTIYLSCSADVFGKSYPTLQNELKGLLAADGCNFTNNPTNADWSITVTCSAREYSVVNMGNSKSYFCYVDAYIVIDKVVTSQRIYEDEVSIKGAHTLGYSEAARAGYKEISQKLGKIIKGSIE